LIIPSSRLKGSAEANAAGNIKLVRNILQVLQQLGLLGQEFGKFVIRCEGQAVEEGGYINSTAGVCYASSVAIPEVWIRDAHLLANHVPPSP